MRPDVGREDLDGRITRLDRISEFAELLRRLIGTQHHMVGPIAAALWGKIRIASLDRPPHAALAGHIGEIYERGGAAEERGLTDVIDAACVKNCTIGHHEGMLHVHMRVY